MIARQAGVMTRLVDDLLDADRMRRGTVALRTRRVDAIAAAAAPDGTDGHEAPWDGRADAA